MPLLPPDDSLNGPAIDALIVRIAIATFAVLLLVHGLLAIALLRRKATRRPSRGNVGLEIAWAVVPAAVLLWVAVGSERLWRRIRSPVLDPSAATILVIGQQFKWNIIYPGPDGVPGRYLVFPKITDAAWPHPPGDAVHWFEGVPGPASLPPAKARQAIDDFLSRPEPAFQLGKDFSDPAGADDDVADAAGRTLYLPVGRPVKIVLMSRDVIHDCYLPNFRQQLYAIPGLTGTLTITATHAGPCGELICGQLCGVGHPLMHTDVIALAADEYHRRFESAP